ncbi:hypothetical protein QYF36_001036 [Acer negundo]|nr:hypothetical protein QYF36_001036 [Acer negundo]
MANAYLSGAENPSLDIYRNNAKNYGKITFSCHLVNILLQRYRKVTYLDTDVGQPEFTAPGFLLLTVDLCLTN